MRWILVCGLAYQAAAASVPREIAHVGASDRSLRMRTCRAVEDNCRERRRAKDPRPESDKQALTSILRLLNVVDAVSVGRWQRRPCWHARGILFVPKDQLLCNFPPAAQMTKLNLVRKLSQKTVRIELLLHLRRRVIHCGAQGRGEGSLSLP